MEQSMAFKIQKPMYQMLGWVCVALGFIGAFLPIMPTTIFLIIAAWAFSKSSERWHTWLREHHIFGETLRSWEEHRAIPVKARRIALFMLAVSFLIIVAIYGFSSFITLIVGLCLISVAVYLISLPVVDKRR